MLLVSIFLINGKHFNFKCYSVELYNDNGISLKDYNDNIIFSCFHKDIYHINIISENE